MARAVLARFLKAVALYREGLVVAVECIFTWYWLADLCVQEGLPLGGVMPSRCGRFTAATPNTTRSIRTY
jgi:hypothetical protein